MASNRRGARALSTIWRARAWILIIAILLALVIPSRGHLAFLLGVLIFIVALLSSVMLHELGHFLTAKKFGMKVTQFFVGFGKTLWSTFRGETEYGVKALPFGGFVKITGMTSIEEVDVADEPRSFRNQPGWQRIIVLAAGSFMHFVLALFLFFVLAIGIGSATTTNTCAGSHVKSPAEVAGLKPNDKIVSVGGKPVGNWNQLHSALSAEKVGQPVPLVVDRGGRDVRVNVTLAAIPGRSAPYLGITSASNSNVISSIETCVPVSVQALNSPPVYQRTSFVGAISYAGDQFANTLTSSASAIGKLPAAVPDLFAKNRANTPAGQVSSVVGVGDVTGQVVEAALPWQAKATVVLYLVASLNIFVGAFNLLPLLPLDGGHLAVVIFERIRAWFNRVRGRPDPGLVDIQRLVPISLLVFALLVGFSTLLIAADIFNPVHIPV
jgi:membrane-associated protease RseP (regulator of RpoE activity)